MYVTPLKVSNSKDLLSSASPRSIEDTLSRLSCQFRKSARWLSVLHPYGNVIRALSNASTIDGERLAEYIAVSVPLHLVDGWIFLARAFDSIKSGDLDTSIHLAYYAELRAAMSLLASEGIGVFNDRHMAIDQAYVPTVWPQPNTHRVTWDLLNSWAIEPSRVTTILTSIRIESRTISEWFDAAGVTPFVNRLVADHWLKSWSVDLSYFSKDRQLRNRTSYRPRKITSSTIKSVDASSEVVDPILRTWDALGPSSDSGGAEIDRALLFRALSLARDQSNLPQQTWDSFIDQLDSVASESLLTQLKDTTLEEHYVFKWAGDVSNPPPAQAVLARATLLLRIANGVCAQRLTISGVTKEDLKFWWIGFGGDFGLWPNSTEPDSFSDLWSDVVDDLDESERELNSPKSSGTMHDLNQILGSKVALTQFSRVPLWLLGMD